MRSILFNSRVLTILAAYALGGYVLTSCVDKDTDYSRPDSGSTPSSFTFNTTQEVQFNVNTKFLIKIMKFNLRFISKIRL